MRFNDGCWVKKPGVEFFAPKQVYFSKEEANVLTIKCPTVFVRDRGSVTEGMILTITISSPAPEIIRVQTKHHLGTPTQGPHFDLKISKDSCLDIIENEQDFVCKSGEMKLVIAKNPFSMTYYRGDELLTKTTGNDLAIVKTNWQGYINDLEGDNENTYIRSAMGIGVGELIYGLGEHFTAFTKNGQNVEMWNEDGGTSTEFSYKNIPFYLTNKGYGVFVNHSEKVSFEVASEFVTRVEFAVKGGELDYFVINGPSMKEVVMRYTDITGKPSLPPTWSFGLWLSTSFTTDYDEKTVTGFIDEMHNKDIPLRAIHFDPYWMKEFHWTSLVFDKKVFPDPKGMLKRFKDKGINVCLWINPYIGQESELFEEGMEKGYFVKRKDGSVWQWDMWTAGMAIVDFTNPAAYKWFQEKLGMLVDLGVTCFKTDFGERIPTNCVWYDGSDPEKMHNFFSYLYNKCVFELLEKKHGKNNAVLYSRCATSGGQQFPIHWGGDCWSDYESMEQSLRGGLSLTMSGFGYWSHDIGGFEETSTPDVYKRWAAFGLLSSHSRLHGSHSYRVPWLYGDEAVDVVRTFAKLKARLMPYIYKNAVETSISGVPMMRSMVMEFTEDKNTHFLDKQYMFGDSLLVAPIFNDKSVGEFYLPEGTWTDYFTGEKLEGGKWYKKNYDYLSMPLFVKENSIIVIGNTDKCADYDYEKDCEVHVYGLKEGATAETVVYNQKAEIANKIVASKINGVVKVTTSAPVKRIFVDGKEL